MVVSLPKESSLPLLKLFGNGEIPAGVTSQAEKNCTYVQSVTNSFFSLKPSHESAPGGLGSQSLWICWNSKGTKHLFFFFSGRLLSVGRQDKVLKNTRGEKAKAVGNLLASDR